MKRIEALAAELETLRSEISELDATEEPTEEQADRFTAALVEWDDKKAEHDRLVERAEKVEAVREASVVTESNREEGTPKAPEVKRTATDPFENLDAVRAGFVRDDDVRSRALAGIDAADDIDDEYREQATKLVQHSNGAARLALLTGSPEYRSAFEKVLESPESYQAFLDDGERQALRAALSTTDANGGYAIPFLLDPTIILTNAGTTNPIRAAATIKTGTSNKWDGITSAGVTAEWKAEGSEAADGSPTTGQPEIEAHLADAYVFGSYEVFQDTNLASELPALIADAKDRLESTAFAVGDGSGKPKGVVTAVTAVTASRVSPSTAGTFTTASIADVYAVINAVPARHRSLASWLANFVTYNTIRRMSESAAGSAFWANLGANTPEELLGRPVLESSEVVSAATTGSNILLAGDFKKYYIYDRIGMSLEYIPQVFGSNGRPTAQRGWFATWRVGGDVVDANAFRVLKL